MVWQKPILALAIVLFAAFSFEWMCDDTLRHPEFLYHKFQSMLRNGTIADRLHLIIFSEHVNVFGRRFIYVWTKHDPVRYVMYLPPDFEKLDLPALQKTSVYQDSNLDVGYRIIGAIAKLLVQLLIASAMVFVFRNELFARKLHGYANREM